MRFLAVFLSLVHPIDLKLHILIILKWSDTWAVISPMLDHHKNAFLDDPKCQKREKEVFDHFLDLGLLDRLDTA